MLVRDVSPPDMWTRGRSFFASLQQRPYLRAVLNNTGWLMLDRLLRALLGVFVGAWVARYLGPGLYGELAYAVAFLAVFHTVANLSLDGILVRELAQHPDQARSYIGTVFRLRFAAGMLAWVGACLLICLVRPEDDRAFAMVAMVGGGLVFQSVDVIDLWFQSRLKSSFSVCAKAAGYCSASVLKVVLILTQAPLWTFALALSLDLALAALALIWCYRLLPADGVWRWDGRIAKALLREAAPYLGASLAVTAYLRLDQLILRQIAGELALGMYSAILPFSQVWQMIPVAICSSLLPRLATLRLNDPGMYRHRLQQVFALMLWGGAGVALLTALSAEWIVRLLLGRGYAGAESILQIHAWSNVFVFAGLAQSLALIADRSAMLGLWKSALGLVACVGANLVLVPRFGAHGAAMAAVFSQGVSAVFSNAWLAPDAFKMQIKALWPFCRQQFRE